MYFTTESYAKSGKKDLNDGKKKKEEPGGAEDGCDILVHIP